MKTKIENLGNFIKMFVLTTVLSLPVLAQDPTPTKLPLTLTVTATNPSCYGVNDGQLVLTLSGGYPPYYYDGMELSGSELVLGALGAGEYYFNFTDAFMASATGLATLTAPQSAQISAIVHNVTAPGWSNGSVELTVTSAYGPVTYNWSTLEQVTWVPTDEDQFGLLAGVYGVTITESNGCVYSKRFIVDTDPLIQFDPNLNITIPGSTSNTPQTFDQQISTETTQGLTIFNQVSYHLRTLFFSAHIKRIIINSLRSIW